MINSPYTTTVGSSYNLKKLTHALQVATISGSLVSNIYPGYPMLRAVVDEKQNTIPLFHHPLIIETPSHEKIMAIDLRPWAGKILSRDGELSIPKNSAADFVLQRAAASWLWDNGSQEELFNISTFPITVYSRWVTSAISKRLGLNAAGQLALQIYSAIFFISQFTDKKMFSTQQSTDVALKISKSLGIPIQSVLEIAPDIQSIESITHLCDALKATEITLSFDNLNPGIVVSLVANSWFGLADNREVAGVALEHPPTLYCMIYAAINNAMFKRTPLSDIVLDMKRKDEFSRFSLMFNGYIERGSQD